MKYLKKFDNYKLNEAVDEYVERVREIINEIEDGKFLELDKYDFNIISSHKDKEDWNSTDEKSIKKKIDKLQIDYEYSINSWKNMIINFNRVDGNLIDSISVGKYENDWFLLTLDVNNDSEYYLCNELEGFYHFIMEKLFQYSKNESFLAKLVEDKFYLVEKFLKRDPEIRYSEMNKFNFYKNVILGKLVINKFSTSLFHEGTLLGFLIENKIDSISNLYFLLENGIITKEQIQKQYPEALVIENSILYMIFDGQLSDLSFMFDDNYGSRHESSRKFVEEIDKYMEDPFDRNYLQYNFRDLYIGNLTHKALNIIKNKIEEIKKDMDEEDLVEFENYESWEEQVEHIDGLSDLRQSIIQAYEECQEQADADEMYKAVEGPVETFFRMNKLIYKDEKMLVRINKDWLIRFDTFEDSTRYLSGGKYKQILLGTHILS